ncbi:hypothetical protein ACJMK2_006624 [Sinanodonta woodiana]|uniref:Uncharacterized protein n=1 Tax=Sinanodonta woodiana TaxID=1069815 RepID=A0ABD3VX69_SINWO
MRSGSDAIIIFLLYTTLTIATATTYMYGQGSKYNSQSINGGKLRNMMNLNNIPAMMKNTRTFPLMRVPLMTGGMRGKNLNSFSQGSSIGVNGLSSGFSGVQNGYGTRMGSVRGGNKHGLGMNRFNNGFGVRMGSQHGKMNKKTGVMSGGLQRTSFSTSYFPSSKANTVPEMNSFGGDFSLMQNGLGSGMGFDYGSTTKMTRGMLGGTQGSSFGTSYLPSSNGNTFPKMNGFGGDINRIENGHGNGIGLGYGSINKMAGGMQGGAQLPSYGISLLSSGNMNGFGGKIGSAGLGTTLGTSVDNYNIGANMARTQNTGIGHSSTGNQGIGGMVSYGYTSMGSGSPWGINDYVFDNVDRFDDLGDLGGDFSSDFDDIFGK